MGIVPNEIHFISPVYAFHIEELTNALRWAESNPLYKLYLWIPDGLLVDTYKQMIETLKQAFVVTKIHVSQWVDAAEVEWKTHTDTFKVKVKHFSSLPSLTPREVLTIEIKNYERRHAIRDLASFWVLHERGGVFIDTDTQPARTALPCGIVAPHDVLFAKFHRSHPKLVSNVMAACPKAANVLSVHDAFLRHYKYDFATTNPRHPRLPAHKEADMQELDTCRHEYSRYKQMERQTGLLTTFERGRKLAVKSRASALITALKIGSHDTADVLGRWVRKRLKVWEPSVPLPVPPSMREEDSAYCLHEPTEEYKAQAEAVRADFARFTINEANDFLDYSFQDKTGCWPRIPSSALGFSPTTEPSLHIPEGFTSGLKKLT